MSLQILARLYWGGDGNRLITELTLTSANTHTVTFWYLSASKEWIRQEVAVPDGENLSGYYPEFPEVPGYTRDATLYVRKDGEPPLHYIAEDGSLEYHGTYMQYAYTGTPITKNEEVITFYWKTLPSYTITYYTRYGGDVYTTYTKVQGSEFPIPSTVPTYEGEFYAFDYWYYLNGQTRVKDLPTLVTSNLNVYAAIKEVQTYNINVYDFKLGTVYNYKLLSFLYQKANDPFPDISQLTPTDTTYELTVSNGTVKKETATWVGWVFAEDYSSFEETGTTTEIPSVNPTREYDLNLYPAFEVHIPAGYHISSDTSFFPLHIIND